MFNIFRSIIERLKALFATTAAQEFEADFLARNAERKAELLRLAARYEAEGLPTVAQELRQQAESLSIQQPLAIVLPAVEHCLAEQPNKPSLPLLAQSPPPNDGNPQPQASSSKKKGDRRDRASA